MAMTTRSANVALLLCTLLPLTARPARASRFSLAASGTITSNTSGDATIPLGAPWTFELTYDTAAPDLDFELIGSPDSTFGRFKNTAAPPALLFFHYRAGDYEVTVEDAAGFGAFSDLLVTFTSINALDINIHAPAFFPPLAGAAASFHADFNAFSTAPVFSSDGLPTNAALAPGSFDQSTVTLLSAAGVASSSSLTSLTLTAVPAFTADFDADGDVDGDDLERWKSAFASGGGDLQGDADGDGDVDGGDFLAWQRQLGDVPLLGAAAAAPEPATMVLFVMMAAGVWRTAFQKR